MLFSEVYSAYFNVVAAIVSEALAGDISAKDISRIIEDKAFSESIMSIPSALAGGQWTIMDKDYKTILMRKPQMPLTLLQKRWLKALSLDPRIALFGVELVGLEDIEPLYTQDDFYYFDRYNDGDSYTDPAYVSHFKMVLTALKEKCRIYIEYQSRHGKPISGTYIPYRLEYSSKDDKFRLETAGHAAAYINLQRIKDCKVLAAYDESEVAPPSRKEQSVLLLLTDERNALERVLLHFADCRKETRRLDGDNYQVQLWYEAQDEAELLIRILSFGPMLRVLSPPPFIDKVRQRLDMQRKLGSGNHQAADA